MDVYRSATDACPRCATILGDARDGKRECARCGGNWIEDEHLRALVEQMAPDLDPDAEIPYARRASAAPLACPFCAQPLQPTRFGGVPIDRCDADGHAGVWLDKDELQQMLHVIGVWYADRRSADLHRPYYEARGAVYGSWTPEPEEDRVTAWDLFRRLIGRPKPPEP